MRLTTLDRVLIVCFLGCSGIVALQCDLLGAATCDNKCRYASVYSRNAGNGSYVCYTLQNANDCYICESACDNSLALQPGTCQVDFTKPQQASL